MSNYRSQSPDTCPDADRLQFEILAKLTPEQTLARALRLRALTHSLTEAGIRDQYPEADEREVFFRKVSTWLDRDIMICVYGWDPECPNPQTTN